MVKEREVSALRNRVTVEKGGLSAPDEIMWVNSRLKASLLCTLFVAMVSFAVMFYYSLTFSKYTAMGMKYFQMISTEYVEVRDRGTRNDKLRDTNMTIKNGLQRQRAEMISAGSKISRDVNAYTSGSTVELLTQEPMKERMKKRVGEHRTISANETPDHEEPRKFTLCPSGRKQVGPLYVNKSVPRFGDVEKRLSSAFNGWVNKGGSWKPTDCQARVKMALIIPFRNRYEQLAIFVRHMHPILRRQNLDYRIFVIEQAGYTPFNRAILFNIGYKEAMKFDRYECLIFHDVDLIPEDDRNEYSCPSSPRHLSVAVDKFRYRLPYYNIFGGVGSFSREHFELINGFSNSYWGWGGEDDDLYRRITAKDLQLHRPSMEFGRYKMLEFYHYSADPDPERFEKLENSTARMATDGLNSLTYKLEKVTERLLYTLVTADVTEAMESMMR